MQEPAVPMKRAVSYARFSTDQQNDKSCADQHADNRRLAARAGCRLVAEIEDSATSGASIKNRPGIQDVLAMIRGGEVDVLIAESTSRIGRDQEDRAHIRKLAEFHGAVIMTADDGVVTDLVDGIRAVVDSQQIRDLKHAVRRGQRGRIAEGKSAGGRCYGYRPVKGEPGQRVIDAAEADIVRRIFAEFDAGKKPREIAFGLNRDGVPAPRGRTWLASAINGSGKRGSGILRNTVYAGVLTWNRVRMVKDPESRKSSRLSRPNAAAEWVRQEVPHLAIIDRALFDRVQQRKAALSRVHPGRQKRPKHILSGLLRCGGCGGGMCTAGADRSGRMRIRCSTAKEGGLCPSPATFYLDAIERTVSDKLRGELGHPDAIAAFVRGYHDEHRKHAAAADRRRAAAQTRIGEIKREIARLVDAIAKGHGDPAVLGPRSSELDAERRTVEAEIAGAAASPPVVVLHPAALRHYERAVARLQAAIGGTVAAGDLAAMDAIRELVQTVTVSRRDGATHVAIVGRLNALLGQEGFPAGRASCRKAVAGARYSFSAHPNLLSFELCAVA